MGGEEAWASSSGVREDARHAVGRAGARCGWCRRLRRDVTLTRTREADAWAGRRRRSVASVPTLKYVRPSGVKQMYAAVERRLRAGGRARGRRASRLDVGRRSRRAGQVEVHAVDEDDVRVARVGRVERAPRRSGALHVGDGRCALAPGCRWCWAATASTSERARDRSRRSTVIEMSTAPPRATARVRASRKSCMIGAGVVVGVPVVRWRPTSSGWPAPRGCR